MSVDPAQLPATLIEDPDQFPTRLPAGVEASKDFYAYVRTAPDGTQHWEFYKRGTGRAAGTGDADPIAATVTIESKQAREAREKAEKDAGAAPTIRNVGGVPHVIAPDGSATPVQTPAGPATATAAPRPGSAEEAEREAQKRVERERNQADPNIRAPIDDEQKLALEEARRKEAAATDERARVAARQEAADILAGRREERAVAAQERTAQNQEQDNQLAREKFAVEQERARNIDAREAEKLRRGEVTTLKDGRTVQVTFDPETGEASMKDISLPSKPLPTGAADFTPDVTKPGAGLVDYARKLRGLGVSSTTRRSANCSPRPRPAPRRPSPTPRASWTRRPRSAARTSTSAART
jgi:hypothetical protein